MMVCKVHSLCKGYTPGHGDFINGDYAKTGIKKIVNIVV
jgi:hypothetical protein